MPGVLIAGKKASAKKQPKQGAQVVKTMIPLAEMVVNLADEL